MNENEDSMDLHFFLWAWGNIILCTTAMVLRGTHGKDECDFFCMLGVMWNVLGVLTLFKTNLIYDWILNPIVSFTCGFYEAINRG